MLKAGLIGAIIGFVYITSLTLISPFCTLCVTPLLGIGIGYLANRFDTPPNVEASLGRGQETSGPHKSQERRLHSPGFALIKAGEVGFEPTRGFWESASSSL